MARGHGPIEEITSLGTKNRAEVLSRGGPVLCSERRRVPNGRVLIWNALGVAASPWRLMAGSKALRVLAYHGADDGTSLRRQMSHLVYGYSPVSLDQVVAHLNGVVSLPPRPVWVTFDDGHPSVVEAGMEVLAEFGVAATMFICPGLVDTKEPFWWRIVERAAELGIAGGTVGELKAMPATKRRAKVTAMLEAVEDRLGEPYRERQLSSSQLAAWIAAGHSVGNHTWDHPTLNTCTPEEQWVQIEKAHRWLADNVNPQHPVFAYPNGNHSPVAEKALSDLGYRIGLLFDHRLARISDPLKLSRIRVNSGDDIASFRARVSGIHPAVHRLLRRS